MPRPLLERKQKLFKLIKGQAGFEYVEHLKGDGATIFEHASKLGLEGIVCKRVDLPYRPGPSKSWLKIKNKAHPAMLRVKEAFELERRVKTEAESQLGSCAKYRTDSPRKILHYG